MLNYIVSCRLPAVLPIYLLLAQDLENLSVPDSNSVHKELLDLKRMLVALTRKVSLERIQ
jgi:hypothetical protein